MGNKFINTCNIIVSLQFIGVYTKTMFQSNDKLIHYFPNNTKCKINPKIEINNHAEGESHTNLSTVFSRHAGLIC